MFIDAVEEDPTGTPMRQIPCNNKFSSSLWISENGSVRRRFYNIFNQIWSWGDILNPHVDENSGESFIYCDNRKISLVKAVALAWLPNMKNKKQPKFRNIEEGSSVTNMLWSDDSEDELILDDQHEEWKDFSEQKNAFPRCNSIQISSLGRFRNKLGEVSEGTFFSNDRMICLPNQGAVNVQDMVDHHFGQANNEKKIPQKKIPQRIQSLIEALRDGVTLEDYASTSNLGLSTIWSYMYEVLLNVSLDEANSLAKSIISESAHKAMYMIFEKNEYDIFSQKAKEYMKHIDYLLCDDPDWKCNPHRFQEIRLLKLLCQRNAII